MMMMLQVSDPIINTFVNVKRYSNLFNNELKDSEKNRFLLYCARCYKLLGYDWKNATGTVLHENSLPIISENKSYTTNQTNTETEDKVIVLLILKHFFMLAQ